MPTSEEKDRPLVLRRDEAIRHFDLPNLLPEGQGLALNTRLGILTLLGSEPGHFVLAEQQFSMSEMRVLVPLLEQYPAYCPDEVLLASFNSGNTREETVERHRIRLHEAMYAGVWDYELRPLRNILSRTRFKLRDLGLGVGSILETGYLLLSLRPPSM